MNWLAIVTLILEFLKWLRERDRTPDRVTLARARRIYRSRRFRDWLRDEKGIELDDE